MVNIQAKHMDFQPQELQLVQRMGAALLRCWERLPSDLQSDFRETAILTEIGAGQSVQVSEQIDALIRAHTGQA